MTDIDLLLKRIKHLQDAVNFEAKVQKEWDRGEKRRATIKLSRKNREKCRALFVRMGFKSNTATELIKNNSIVTLLTSCLTLEGRIRETKKNKK